MFRSIRRHRPFLGVSFACSFALAFPCAAAAGQKPRAPDRTVLHAGLERSVIYVKFQDDLGVRCAGGALLETRPGALAEARELLLRHADARWVRQHGVSDEDLESLRRRGERASGKPLIDMRTEFRLFLAPGDDAASAIDAWNALACVELAAPVQVPPPLPSVPDLHAGQTYLGPSPDGVGCAPAREHPGGDGSFSRIVDIEYGFDLLHPEVSGVPTLDPLGTNPLPDVHHGTAVLAMLGGLPDGEGTSGANALSRRFFTGAYNTQTLRDVARAISFALVALRGGIQPQASTHGGDVILLEQQSFGPAMELLPCEWEYSTYRAIETAVALGVTVVEAAANGGVDLDAPQYQVGHAPFAPGNDSGAILVGAGAAPGGTDVARSRLWFSNFGSTVDLQGWGERVVTAGYGDLYTGPNGELYTAQFSGTSSASPMVAAACAQLQSIHYAATGSQLAPAQVRELLRSSARAQQNGIYPASQSIGPLPDVAAAVERAGYNRCQPATAWSAITAPLGPIQRRANAASASASLHEPGGVVVVFGGVNAAGQRLDDTIGLRAEPAAAWVSLGGAVRPSPRFDTALVFDPVRARCVLYAGDSGVPTQQETWELDLEANVWSLRPAVGPGARSAHALAYDVRRERVVLFGGLAPAGAALNDTWTYDGVAWTVSSGSGTLPEPRYGHALAYDARRERVVLFGGHASNGQPLGDTWEWDGASWTRRSSSGPAPRFAATLVYDASRSRCVLLGGSSNVGAGVLDAWAWDGFAWRTLAVANPGPNGRYQHSAAYDPRTESIVVFGGRNGSGIVLDTWRLATEREPGAPTCSGDGISARCPCSNHSTRGACTGCRNASGGSARLRARGLARLSDDDVSLDVSGVTGGIALFVQGDPLPAGPVPFAGDGVDCLGGPRVLLGARATLGGTATLGRLSVRGLLASPRTCEYQVRYRNLPFFCTTSTTNTSNAYRITWSL